MQTLTVILVFYYGIPSRLPAKFVQVANLFGKFEKKMKLLYKKDVTAITLPIWFSNKNSG